jgi:N-acyl-L-homoserine lactone synthetase
MGTEATRSTFSDHAGAVSSFSDRITRLSDRIDYRIVDSGEQGQAIFRLRYQAYIRDGTISPNSSGRFSDPYDETGNVYLLGLYIDDELASSIRLHVASREHPVSPSLEVFADVLQPKLDVGKIIIDTTHFVADENLARLHRGLPYATLRLCMLAARYFKADHLLAAASAAHQVFYQRAFGYRLIGEPRPYPLLAKSLGLMTADYPAATDQLYRRYPFFCSPFFERRMLFERPMAGSLQPGASASQSQSQVKVQPPSIKLGAANAAG